MLKLGDSEILKTNSKLLLFLDNRTKKYLSSFLDRIPKDSQKKYESQNLKSFF